MSKPSDMQVGIVDYGMGNLFSVRQACEQAGLRTTISSSPQQISAADAVILPGVGAFGDAMQALGKLDLVGSLQDFAASPKPLIGICLGMQLMLTESHEFGSRPGLGIIEGEVVRLEEESVEGQRALKVPQVGWNQIHVVAAGSCNNSSKESETAWTSPMLAGISDREYMYFAHSFYPKPVDPSVVVSTTRYGGTEFCSSLRSGSIFACQFHPERSGAAGLRVYHNLAKLITAPKSEWKNA